MANRIKTKQYERNVQLVIKELQKMIKRYDLQTVRAGVNRYFTAVRTIKKLQAQVSKGEREIKHLLGKVKL